MKGADLLLLENEDLSARTSLGLGGRAEFLAEARSVDEIGEALRWARDAGKEVKILGGGSNVVVADEGVDGLVLRVATAGLDFHESVNEVKVCAAAGECWDDVVAAAVDRGLWGLECLSGIPGLVGATPVQNVGAYGVEVSDLIEQVAVLDRLTLERALLRPDECDFRYRGSRFKDNPDRFVVTEVTLGLNRGGTARLDYPELARAMDARSSDPTPGEVRDAVLELRRSKGMVLDEGTPANVGSFFVNPVVTAEGLSALQARAKGEAPVYPLDDGGFKVPAAWLIERAGISPGLQKGRVGVSPRHTLALVHYGGGSTADLVCLAADIRSAVERAFGVLLTPEPVFWGFPEGDVLKSRESGVAP